MGDSGDSSIPENYALRVALQTMKERCQSLQQRLNIVEDENFILRNNYDSKKKGDFNSGNPAADDSAEIIVIELRKQISDLEQHKVQLTEHIGMVANENRQLWSRLSQLSKERNSIDAKQGQSSVVGQNLIRSKTFTQHSPNPNLRHKHIANNEDTSLEEIALKNSSSGVANNNTKKTNLGFSYLNDENCTELDSNTVSGAEVIMETIKCIDGFSEIKRDQLQQQHDLKILFCEIKKTFANRECNNCKKENQKPETAEKSSETDESFAGGTTQNSEEQDELPKECKQIDFIEEKRLADERDKTCPLCGIIYSSNVKFEDFRTHVETHFIEDPDLEAPNLGEQFEFISHTVGNF